MPWIEVEVIYDASGEGGGVDGAGGCDGGVPVLELCVGFECDVVGEAVVEAPTEGVNEGVGADVSYVFEVKAGVVIVDLAAAEEGVDVGMEFSQWEFHFGAEEEVFLAADVAFVDGIGAAKFERGLELAEEEEGEIGAGGDAEIFTALKVGKGAGKAAESGELKVLGSGRGRLRECALRRRWPRRSPSRGYTRRILPRKAQIQQ